MKQLSNNELYFCSVHFSGLTVEQLFTYGSKEFQHIITVNADYLQQAHSNSRLYNLLQSNLATFDGQIIYLLAKLKYPYLIFEKISGSDLIFRVCEYCQLNNKRIFLLGGKEEANIQCVSLLKNKYNISIDGYSPPYMKYPFTSEIDEIIKAKIADFKPDYLFVGFGAPKQDYWIDDHRGYLKERNVHFAVGSGGTFELTSGMQKRAPLWVQKIGFEWFFRLIQEPKRLWKRYLFGNINCLRIYVKTELFK